MTILVCMTILLWIICTPCLYAVELFNLNESYMLDLYTVYWKFIRLFLQNICTSAYLNYYFINVWWVQYINNVRFVLTHAGFQTHVLINFCKLLNFQFHIHVWQVDNININIGSLYTNLLSMYLSIYISIYRCWSSLCIHVVSQSFNGYTLDNTITIFIGIYMELSSVLVRGIPIV